MFRVTRFIIGFVALVLMGAASQASAGPRAVTGCTTITNPGAYVVSNSINGSGVAGDCIVIDQSNVTLDLGGMVISGPGAFGSTAGGHGVHVICCSNSNVEIRNGSVVGWISGIVADSSVKGMTVEHVRALDNDGVGIYVWEDSNLTANYASGNTNFGILFGAGSVVMRNIANGNTGGTGGGIQGDCDSVVMFNTSVGNGGTDFSITNSAGNPGCIVEGNTSMP